ncbi:MAG TPA: adenylate/guanylate cyclase domain-containing protein, partial [Phenylobacterium sp.]|nr:adenylate/guanylate cyclase domain-containing protein [Phenylobacterium sp.]
MADRLRAVLDRAQRVERAVSHYVPPKVLERLMADPDGVGLGGELRDVTVLFADVRGFMGLAEAMKDDPRRLTDLTNAILDPMTDIVLAHGGVIDKYMGDCLMAFWGAPDDDPAHARSACEAAAAMLRALPEVNRRVAATFGDLPPIELGIGVNSGACIVGNVGGRKRFDYSVLGDPVNVASRLQELCKAYDAPLLLGEETAARLGADTPLRELDRIRVR